MVSDIDAGFSLGLHEMGHCCGGTWKRAVITAGGRRGVSIHSEMEGDDRARAIAQMANPAPKYGGLGYAVNIKAVPSSDPLAYVTGWMDGFHGAPAPASDSDNLASEYTRGRLDGAKVRVGRGQAPDWMEL